MGNRTPACILAAVRASPLNQSPLQLLDTRLQHEASTLRAQFRSAEPFPHVVIDEFLNPDYCRALIDEFPAFDQKHALNEYGQTGGKAVFQNLVEIGPSYARFDGLLRSQEFLSLISEITGIPDLLYDPEYVGGGTHENLRGQELDPHVDFNFHPRTKTHRRLNLIVYLNPVWEQDWGGSLELHLNPWSHVEDRVTAVLPIANRSVIFETSECSWHGFQKIRTPEGTGISRRSVAVYFYTKERPAEEEAPSHSTVYVPRPLPAHFRAGYTLAADDVREIGHLLERRDKQIRFLYEREKESSASLARILQSPTFRFARLLTWPIRKIRGS